MKYKLVAFWLIVFGALFAFLQMCFEYHFYYIEQSQLFLFSEAYIRNKLLLPGGFSMLVAEFLVQFFIRPYVGALVTAVLLTGVGVCTAGIVKRIAPVSGLFILYVLPFRRLPQPFEQANHSGKQDGNRSCQPKQDRNQHTTCHQTEKIIPYPHIPTEQSHHHQVANSALYPVIEVEMHEQQSQHR